MYKVSVSTSFIAQHFLIGGDFGKENDINSHLFKVEIIISNQKLNSLNYVVYITILKNYLQKIKNKYEDNCLNDFIEFENVNPSIEYFSKVILDDFVSKFPEFITYMIEIKIWEDNECFASYSHLI